AYYVYDSAGRRVRKVWEHDGVVEERLYLGGYERYRRTSAGTLQVERTSLHVMDDTRRICLIETTTTDTTQAPLTQPAVVIRSARANPLAPAAWKAKKPLAITPTEKSYPMPNPTSPKINRATEAALKRYRHTGKERDEESGLYYFGARFYAPWLGRWTS